MQQPRNPSAVKLKLSHRSAAAVCGRRDNVLLATPVTVGTVSDPTPHGNYTIYLKVANRRRQSNPGAGYPMTYWMEFKSAYGLHWGFKTISQHARLRPHADRCGPQDFPASPCGTPIHIARSQPWDATIGKTLPVLDDSSLPDPPMSYMLSPRVFADASRGNVWTY